jgi:signal transduction histidine kinase
VLYHADPAKLGRLASEMGLPPGLDEPVTRWIGDRLLRGRPVPEIGVLMCADVDAAPLIVPARRAAAFMMAAACAIVIVAGVLVAILTRGFRSSLRELVVASDAVARGDFGHRVPVRSQDELGHLAGSMNRMAAEVQNLTRAREIEARLASVARVGAALAHDLKGMVMGLSLLAENLEQRYASPGSRERALETLRTLAARMKRMVLRLGTAPPPETVRPDRVDLNRLLRGAAETLGLCAESRLAIVEAFADPAPVVRGDEDGLARVAQNLLSNAGEAMPEGGTLTLGTAETVEGGIPMALFTVGDSGPGMDPRFVEERLFRPFETTKQSGLGLGLFSSREFIERHGGTIRVRTTPGGGTTFEVRLPAIRNTEDA